MKCVEVIFWVCVFMVFYTYIGYGILLYVLVRIKELFVPPQQLDLPQDLPEVTLLIAAYNEEDIIAEKMVNCQSLRYQSDRLHVVWITDGSTDRTNALLDQYADVKVLFEPARGGKAAAFNRAMNFINTPIVVYTDANTMLCEQAITEIVTAFSDPRVGCVSGEKRVSVETSQGATAGEGIYWKYESALKALDHRLFSTIGAAGELFAIRTPLYVELPIDTLLDDFVLSIKIVQKGYKIAYCKDAYAVESASADMSQEKKRKVRISAGGLQSIWRLRSMMNIFHYGVFSFQFISHKVFRWTIAPLALFALLPINIALVAFGGSSSTIYAVLLVMQLLFYSLGIYGYSLKRSSIENKLVYIPYYFLFMNLSVISGVWYLRKHRGSGAWEKARRG